MYNFNNDTTHLVGTKVISKLISVMYTFHVYIMG